MNKCFGEIAVQGLNRFKSKIRICRENNWLSKMIFRDYLDGETEHKYTYQRTVKEKQKSTVHICHKKKLDKLWTFTRGGPSAELSRNVKKTSTWKRTN
jgi:hypothetical protein